MLVAYSDFKKNLEGLIGSTIGEIYQYEVCVGHPELESHIGITAKLEGDYYDWKLDLKTGNVYSQLSLYDHHPFEDESIWKFHKTIPEDALLSFMMANGIPI